MGAYKPNQDIFKGEHTFVQGRTRNGKTYFVLSRLKHSKLPVLFYNAQHEDAKGYVRADMNTDISLIRKALQKGYKVDYRPSKKNDIASLEFDQLAKMIFEKNLGRSVIFAIDEVHILNNFKSSRQQLDNLAFRGVAWGVYCCFITQRPANAPKSTYTQAETHYIFKSGMEKAYFREKGIDYEKSMNLIEKGGKYSYIVYNGVDIMGAYKE